MAAAIQKELPGTEVELLKGGRGDFIVMGDGVVVWDKKRMGDEFPDEEDVVEELRGT